MGKLLAALLCAGIAGAQAPDPQDPKTDSAAVTPKPEPSRDDTHILGVVPNFTAVNEPQKVYRPISVSEKFSLAAHDSFDPFNWVMAGIYAGVYQAQNAYPQFGQGSQGYAKRYGATFADGTISTYISEGILPALLHEDPRFFRLGVGSKWRRAGYAFTRVLITRVDSGKQRFNTSEIAGNLGAAALGVLYNPPLNRNATYTMDKFAVNVLSDAGFNVLREFWPDMRRKVLHKGDPEPVR
jgi:hypothetical protein